MKTVKPKIPKPHFCDQCGKRSSVVGGTVFGIENIHHSGDRKSSFLESSGTLGMASQDPLTYVRKVRPPWSVRGLASDESNTNDNVFNDIVKNRNSQYDLISQRFKHYERPTKVDKSPE